jgi:hypothetical protein
MIKQEKLMLAKPTTIKSTSKNFQTQNMNAVVAKTLTTLMIYLMNLMLTRTRLLITPARREPTDTKPLMSTV